MKTSLTPEDEMRLDAARGLHKVGIRPTVKQYNDAIAANKYCGAPIQPIGGSFLLSSEHGHNDSRLHSQGNRSGDARKAARKRDMDSEKPNQLRPKKGRNRGFGNVNT